jgi:hypothetical protein
MSDEKRNAEALDAIISALPADKLDAAATATAACAATVINAGLTDDEALRGLSVVITELRKNGAGEVKH